MQKIVDVQTIAYALGISDRTARRLANRGILVKHENGHYDLAGCVQGYIEYVSKQVETSILRKYKKEQS